MLCRAIRCLFYIIADFFNLCIRSKIKTPYLSKDKERSWAIVTGASGGIGEQYCYLLASKKLNVCLIGRNEAQLKKISNIIISKFAVETLICIHDFAGSDPTKEETFKLQLKPILPYVSILINNAGVVGHKYTMDPRWLDPKNPETSLSAARQLMKVNVDSYLLLTTVVAPYMIENKQGAIIFMSSFFAYYPMYSATLYCGSKTCVSFISHGLFQDLTQHNIHVLTVAPGFVKTSMIPKVFSHCCPKFLVPDPLHVASSALSVIGLQYLSYGTFAHSVMINVFRYLVDTLPTFIADWVVKRCIVRASKLESDYIQKNK